MRPNTRLRQGTQSFRDDLRAISNEVAAKGLGLSGAHVIRRVEALAQWMQTITDQCFEEVTRLPGSQMMHREVHEPFLHQQLLGFFSTANCQRPEYRFVSELKLF